MSENTDIQKEYHCRKCNVQVENLQKKCLSCGEPHPYKTKEELNNGGRGVLYTILFLCIVGTISGVYNNSKSRSQSNPQPSISSATGMTVPSCVAKENWMNDKGTLHESSASAWLHAACDNRIITAGDHFAGYARARIPSLLDSIPEEKYTASMTTYAERMDYCITTMARKKQFDSNIKVSDLASECFDNLLEKRGKKPASLTVKQNEYGEKWPYTIPEGVLNCENKLVAGYKKHYVTISYQGSTYAINGSANGTSNYKPLKEIWRDNPEYPDSKIPDPGIIEKGLQLCEAQN